MRRAIAIVVGFVILIVVALGAVNAARPVPALRPVTMIGTTLTVGHAPTFSWPAGTEGAMGTASLGVLAQTSGQAPQPTGSVAKAMTALVALQKLPLVLGQQGPSTTVTSADVATQQADAAAGQSTVPVAAGEALTEYQVLQGMLLPSGNNLADLLAGWAFGSTGAALTAMTTEARKLGMTRTTFTDPSGFDPTTTSTPADLVRLGMAVMGNPVLAQIVGQQQATLPVAGTVSNIDSVLGQSGIIGIKTGNTTGQNGAFLFAAPATSVGGQLIIGAVMGASDLGSALDGGVSLVAQAQRVLQTRTIVRAGTPVAQATAPWSAILPLVAERPLTVAGWGGLSAHLTVVARPLHAPVAKGAVVGSLAATVGSKTVRTPLVAATPLHAPSWTWRLLRRPQYVPAGDWPS